MYQNKRILGIISGRGGSKGLPHKNVRPLCSKPLIAWTITEALKSRYLDRVIVNTEDKNIALISKRYGAEVPFIRPKKLATDKASMIDVILHAMKWIEKNDGHYDIVMLLQPTSPLRRREDIDNSIKLLFSKKAKSIISVCKTEHHPYWSNTLPKNMSMENFIRQDAINKNRQKLPCFYRLNGAIYLIKWDNFKKKKSFYGKNSFAYIMPKERSVDIDSELDFKLAEILIRKLQNR